MAIQFHPWPILFDELIKCHRLILIVHRSFARSEIGMLMTNVLLIEPVDSANRPIILYRIHVRFHVTLIGPYYDRSKSKGSSVMVARTRSKNMYYAYTPFPFENDARGGLFEKCFFLEGFWEWSTVSLDVINRQTVHDITRSSDPISGEKSITPIRLSFGSVVIRGKFIAYAVFMLNDFKSQSLKVFSLSLSLKRLLTRDLIGFTVVR